MKFLTDLGITVKNEDLLLEALTHSSYANEHSNTKYYERLEFLGDAVLQLASSDYFYKKYDLNEGDMSKVRASYVCENALYEYSNAIGLTPNIRVGNGTEKTPSIVADCFESVLAVIYLEHGFSVAKKYALGIIEPYVEKGIKFITDYKSYLQEMVQPERTNIEYKVINEEGPQNDKVFTVEVIIDGIRYGVGSGKSKKQAEQNAAKNAIEKIA